MHLLVHKSLEGRVGVSDDEWFEEKSCLSK